MDSKVIVLLVFILFAIVVSFMVGNGMIDLTSIYERVTKSQAEQGLGGVKLQIVSPVPSVYYQAQAKDFDSDGNTDAYALDLGGILKITGQNLKDKVLTISVASPHWMLSTSDMASAPTDLEKTKQLTFGTDLTVNNDVWTIASGKHLYLVRGDLDKAPFQMPEFVELIFAVGETAKAEVTIVAEPSA